MDSIFESYARLAQGLIGELAGASLLDGERRPLGTHGSILLAGVRGWIDELGWNGTLARQPASRMLAPGQLVTAVPLEQSDTTLLGIFCVQQAAGCQPGNPARHAADLGRRLQPLLDCIYRDLQARVPIRERMQTLTERTAELEWLFKVVSQHKGGGDDRYALRELLAAATDRLETSMGICSIPDKRICVEFMPEAVANSKEIGWHSPRALRGVWTQASQSLLNWAQRRREPLVINSAGRDGDRMPRCKILAVPVMRDSGKVIGVLAFINPPFAQDFSSRHVYLARHLGLQAANVVDLQFDLMTGLYTQGALDQVYTGIGQEAEGEPCALIRLDIDHMHVVNQTHGFEIGNELIVRIADLLSPPLMPASALAARLSGDRFAIVLPKFDARAAQGIANAIQGAVKELRIGPVDNPVEVSVSCGVADIVPMPQGLERSLGAAEIACKTAKSRGGNRVELYASDDRSMMRRQDDAIAVGRLRAALKGDRLLLLAQRFKPARDASLPGGYEIVVRMRDEAGDLVPLGALLRAAQRYNLIPSIDGWVTQRALQLLAPYAAMLRSRGIEFLLPLASQSFADAAFVGRLSELLRDARLPQGCITLLVSEQAATESLVHARALTRRMKKHGCRYALDDFSMGKDSVLQIQNLEITRLRASVTAGAAAIRSIVEFGRMVSAETLVTGVDSESLSVSLQRSGIDYLQGTAIGGCELLEDLLHDLTSDESRRQERLRLELG